MQGEGQLDERNAVKVLLHIMIELDAELDTRSEIIEKILSTINPFSHPQHREKLLCRQ